MHVSMTANAVMNFFLMEKSLHKNVSVCKALQEIIVKNQVIKNIKCFRIEEINRKSNKVAMFIYVDMTCNSNPCQNGGTCSNLRTTADDNSRMFKCECTGEYTGILCQERSKYTTISFDDNVHVGYRHDQAWKIREVYEI